MISNDPKQPTQVTSALALSTGQQRVSNPEFGYVDNTLVVGHASATFTSGKKEWFTITGQKVSAVLPGIGQATAAMVGKVNVMALGAGVMWIGGSLVYHAAKDGKTHAFDVADYDVHVTVAGSSTDGAGSEPSATETPAPAVTETPAAAPASQKKPRGKKTDVPAASAPAADVTAPAAPTAPAAATTPAPRQGRGRTVAEAPAAPAAPALQVVAAPAAGTAQTRAPRQPRPVASIPA